MGKWKKYPDAMNEEELHTFRFMHDYDTYFFWYLSPNLQMRYLFANRQHRNNNTFVKLY